jgi:alkylation response protein AidB-like acyl-CoA dehydrogenase
MEFGWSAAQLAYRERLRDFIAKSLPTDWDSKSNYDPGSPYVVEFAREFCPALAREGLLIPHWPREHGGGGADPLHHWILGEEMFAVGEPRSYQYMNVNWIGPAILRYGTPAQKALHIRPIVGGTVFWCQGFSEPSAGSDLASLKTRAVRSGDEYVINGQKIWTSAASFARHCFLLARTGETKREISVFLVPMDVPGIQTREIMSMTGRRSLHEVFLTDVRVPAATLLGEEHKGWEIVRSVLHNERVGAPRYIMADRALDAAAKVLRQQGRLGDREIQGRLGQARAAVDASRLLCLRIIDGRMKKRDPGAETNIARYSLTLADRAVGDFIGEFMHDTLLSGTEQTILTQFRRAASTGLGAGAAEIQLDLIAQNFLELARLESTKPASSTGA